MRIIDIANAVRRAPVALPPMARPGLDCVPRSYFLHRLLKNLDIDNRIVFGTLKCDAGEFGYLGFPAISDSEVLGHFWVEVDGRIYDPSSYEPVNPVYRGFSTGVPDCLNPEWLEVLFKANEGLLVKEITQCLSH